MEFSSSFCREQELASDNPKVLFVNKKVTDGRKCSEYPIKAKALSDLPNCYLLLYLSSICTQIYALVIITYPNHHVKMI